MDVSAAGDGKSSGRRYGKADLSRH